MKNKNTVTDWTAKWIWADVAERRPQNQTVIFRKAFKLPEFSAATLAITADSQYRLFINGRWIEDGPCRSWPKHFQYDVIDVTRLLETGRNVIAVVARHYGYSTFHKVPQEAGMLAQLDVQLCNGEKLRVKSDRSWRARISPAHRADTARSSIQQEATEWYDATQEIPSAVCPDINDRDWPKACEFRTVRNGPWKDLHPRDVRFLTREPAFPLRLLEARVVSSPAHGVTFDLKRLCYPQDLTANIMAFAAVLGTIIVADRAREIHVDSDSGGFRITCGGKEITDGTVKLQAGENLFVVLVHNEYGHGCYDLGLAFSEADGLKWRNPCAADDPNPWAMINLAEGYVPPSNAENTTHDAGPAEFAQRVAAFSGCGDAASFKKVVADRYRPVSPEKMFLANSYLPFRFRKVQDDARPLVQDASALLSANHEWTAVNPASAGDIELCLDFGRELVGWVEFELQAAVGTIVDVNLIEFRIGDELQHTGGNRNGFRYICKDGLNTFVSQKRRAGRYLFLTLRNQTGPVRIRTVSLDLATYPIERRGEFRCSDPLMTRIWEISAYTLRLCMEDTYTDCPLYEQTLWVGDARNESLYNNICFGADDITLRCLRLTAQSLDDLPITACQVPSGWDSILTAWSLLWVQNVWEYFLASGDRDGLTELYPAVKQNLKAIEKHCTERGGLLSIKAWNLFDWAPIDQDHNTVMHNSLFLVGALDATREAASALNHLDDVAWIDGWRKRVRNAVIALWDPVKCSYPDAVRNDGTISPKISQHTSALALLNDVLPDDNARDCALRNLISPPEGMVKIGSPFALQYVMEALEKVGDARHAVELIRNLWRDMIDSDASTCWETFRGWEARIPTRSHCHAWSSAPVYVFNRSVLGILPVAPGSAEVVISPHPCDLESAEGASASPHGPLRVSWRVKNNELHICVDMPAAVRWRAVRNADWQAFTRVTVNGELFAG